MSLQIKVNAEFATLFEKQKEHEECTTKLLEEAKQLAKSSVANLTSKGKYKFYCGEI
jgi:hypothetical protein